MNRSEISLEFIEAFCAADLDRLERVLEEDLHFEGPLLRADSRDAYLAGLRANPPEEARYEVKQLVEGPDGVAVLWEYQVADRQILISQWNRFSNTRIVAIVLVLDTAQLRE